MIANKRYRMGKPILSDDEYDTLRKKLKGEGSVVALHDEATCKLDTGICKVRRGRLSNTARAAHPPSSHPAPPSPPPQVDLRVDNAKMRLLYFPGVAGGLILGCELSFWTLHIDPLLSIVLSAVPAYFFGKWFTENIFAQKPLVTQARRAPRSADASQPAPPHPGPARHAGAVPQVQRADDRLLRRLLLRQDRRRDRAEGAARGRARGQVRDVQ